MTIQALGYLGIGVANVDDWSEFATRTVGMQAMTAAPPAARFAWTTAASG